MTEIESLSLCDISFEAEKWLPQKKDIVRLSIEVINEVREEFPLFRGVGHIDVILGDSAFVQDLNNRYRGKNKPTNVLSFPQDDYEKGRYCPDESLVLLGDIVMAYEVIESEAKTEEKTFLDHFCHLLVHGILHLLGFDHETDDEQDEMESLEIKILNKLNIDNPYKAL